MSFGPGHQHQSATFSQMRAEVTGSDNEGYQNRRTGRSSHCTDSENLKYFLPANATKSKDAESVPEKISKATLQRLQEQSVEQLRNLPRRAQAHEPAWACVLACGVVLVCWNIELTVPLPFAVSGNSLWINLVPQGRSP